MSNADTTKISTADAFKALLENQQENDAFIRHYEDTRFKISQLTVTLSGLLVGASKIEALNANRYLIAAFIVLLGINGFLITAKYTERADRHATIARAYRRALSKLAFEASGVDLEKIHLDAAKQHAESGGLNGQISKIRARYFWMAIHVGLAIVGIFVAVL